jgi:hypothetical protein
MLTVPIPLPLASLVPAVELFVHRSTLHGQAHVSRVMVHAFRLLGLDRVRLGDLDPRRLRNPRARDMIAFAEALFEETNRIVPVGPGHFAALWPEATRLARLAASDPRRALGAEGNRCDD